MHLSTMKILRMLRSDDFGTAIRCAIQRFHEISMLTLKISANFNCKRNIVNIFLHNSILTKTSTFSFGIKHRKITRTSICNVVAYQISNRKSASAFWMDCLSFSRVNKIHVLLRFHYALCSKGTFCKFKIKRASQRIKKIESKLSLVSNGLLNGHSINESCIIANLIPNWNNTCIVPAKIYGASIDRDLP